MVRHHCRLLRCECRLLARSCQSGVSAVRSLSGGKRTSLGQPILVAIDPNVWSGRALQVDFAELAVSGLASMYPVSDWSRSAPDHHGYQRACDLITGQTSTGHLGHQFSHAPGRPNLHLVSSSRRPRQVKRSIWLRHRGLLISALCCRWRGIGIKRIGSQPDPSSAPRRPGREPERSRRCGRACWQARSPARCDAAASWPPRSIA